MDDEQSELKRSQHQAHSVGRSNWEPGTTVIVSRLFETLPVRRKELQRTAKKQFCKLLTVVHSLALSRTDVRFCVSSILDGRQHQILSTPGGSASIKEVLISLFGARSDKNAVLDIVQRAPDNEVCSIYGHTGSGNVDWYGVILHAGAVLRQNVLGVKFVEKSQ
uniref:Uncharacterized protein n=1 Tax=Parascaris equorum TaxID=6256 RepID=A0A914RWJ4_PAREQ